MRSCLALNCRLRWPVSSFPLGAFVKLPLAASYSSFSIFARIDLHSDRPSDRPHSSLSPLRVLRLRRARSLFGLHKFSSSDQTFCSSFCSGSNLFPFAFVSPSRADRTLIRLRTYAPSYRTQSWERRQMLPTAMLSAIDGRTKAGGSGRLRACKK